MPHSFTQPPWQLLQISDVLDLEFATALAETVPVLAWQPQRFFLPGRVAAGTEAERIEPNSTLRVRNLPLLRGFARAPISFVARTGSKVTARLLRQTPQPELSPLICTVPFFAPVAERWPGPVIYWLTDLIAEYSSAKRAQVQRLDRRLCRAATLLCPNSERLANYLVAHAGCDPAKIHIVPNATRASNLLPLPPTSTATRPAALEDIPRPLAGVIGNLAGNMDWLFLERTLALTPWLSWVFVGPTSMHIPDPVERRARESVMQHPNAHFVGKQKYGDLVTFARAFNVAVLPYKRREPTYSGSSTRFYEHLAACRPMIATRGLEELTRKEPLLRLVDTAEQMSAALLDLRAQNFDDGLLTARWHASQEATWQFRAQSVQDALAARIAAPQPQTAQASSSVVFSAT